jgi:uncharacterized CHY-type Zn-finger protein
MPQPPKAGKIAFRIRTTLERKLNHLSLALASKETADIISAFENLATATQELKQFFMEQQTIICPHCKTDTQVITDNKELTCPNCQQKIHYCPVSKFRCEVFDEEFDANDKERLDRCKYCLERTDTITCSHLELLP